MRVEYVRLMLVVIAGVMVFASAPAVAPAQEAGQGVRQEPARTLPPVALQERKARLNRESLSRNELAAKPAANLYDVVMALRSHWMRGPATVRSSIGLSGGGGVMAGPIPGTIVYVDGLALGPLTTLRTIPAESAEKLCYYSLNKAQGRFGLRVQAPVVEVFTRESARGDDAC